jgi:hypothetical protein
MPTNGDMELGRECPPWTFDFSITCTSRSGHFPNAQRAAAVSYTCMSASLDANLRAMRSQVNTWSRIYPDQSTPRKLQSGSGSGPVDFHGAPPFFRTIIHPYSR